MEDHASLPTPVPHTFPAELAEGILSPTIYDLASATMRQTAALSAMTTATSSSENPPSGDAGSGAENGECKLLGPFALLVQGALGLLALLSLVYKRWRERPQRPVKIWAFDASKQVVGSALLHIANLLMSIMSSGDLIIKANSQANPCSFYLLNLAIDTTVGIPILVVLLRVLTYAFSLTPLGDPPESVHSGNYGRPPKTVWWLKQSFIYFLGLLGMKFCVFVIFQLCPWVIIVGDWALRWTKGNKTLQIFFVMLFFPVVMNAIQYYIIDSFIKDQKPSDHELIPSEDGDGVNSEEEQHRRSLGEYDDTGDTNITEESMKDGSGSGSGSEVGSHDDEGILKLRSDHQGITGHHPGIDGEGSSESIHTNGHRSLPQSTNGSSEHRAAKDP